MDLNLSSLTNLLQNRIQRSRAIQSQLQEEEYKKRLEEAKKKAQEKAQVQPVQQQTVLRNTLTPEQQAYQTNPQYRQAQDQYNQQMQAYGKQYDQPMPQQSEMEKNIERNQEEIAQRAQNPQVGNVQDQLRNYQQPTIAKAQADKVEEPTLTDKLAQRINETKEDVKYGASHPKEVVKEIGTTLKKVSETGSHIMGYQDTLDVSPHETPEQKALRDQINENKNELKELERKGGLLGVVGNQQTPEEKQRFQELRQRNIELEKQYNEMPQTEEYKQVAEQNKEIARQNQLNVALNALPMGGLENTVKNIVAANTGKAATKVLKNLGLNASDDLIKQVINIKDVKTASEFINRKQVINAVEKANPLIQEARKGEKVFRGTIGKGEVDNILAGKTRYVEGETGGMWAKTPEEATNYAKGHSMSTGMATRKPTGDGAYILEGIKKSNGEITPTKATEINTGKVIDLSQPLQEGLTYYRAKYGDTVHVFDKNGRPVQKFSDGTRAENLKNAKEYIKQNNVSLQEGVKPPSANMTPAEKNTAVKALAKQEEDKRIAQGFQKEINKYDANIKNKQFEAATKKAMERERIATEASNYEFQQKRLAEDLKETLVGEGIIKSQLKPESTVTPPKVPVPTLSKSSSYTGGIAPKSGNVKQMSAFRKFFTGGEKILNRSGEGGKKLYQTLEAQRKAEDLLRGRWNVHIDQALEGLNKQEIANVDATLRGEASPMNAKTAGAYKSLRNWYNSIGKKAEEMGFEIKSSSGIKTPFKMRENYAPQMYDFTKLQKGAQREKALNHLVESGQARNKAEATRLLDDFIKRNAERRFGNLEKAREINLPGFIRDPRFYSKKYAQSAAKRFTEVEHFGRKDSKVAEFIDQIAEEGGDYNEAQRIFDYMVKGAPQNKVVNALTQINLATQLDLSAITNATQSLNTATKAGTWNTVKGIGKSFTKKGREVAELAGVYDDFIQARETGVDLNKIVKAVMWPFQKVENFNRRVAANVGAIRAKQLATRFQKQQEGMFKKFAESELKNLGIDPATIKNGRLSKEQMLGAAYEMARKTQFKVEPIDVPPAWKRPVGKLVTQFQSFSFMQTKFIRDTVLKEAIKGNFAPLIRFIPLAIGASYATNYVRNLITGRDPNKATKDMDIRAWDKWGKAFGDFATNKIIQGKFLYDTYKSEYNTPLKKVTRTLASIGGPTVGKGGTVLTGLESLQRESEKAKEMRSAIASGKVQARDPWLELKRYAAGEIPFIGEWAKNKLFSYPVSTKTPEEKAKSATFYDFMDELRKEVPNSQEEKRKMQDYIMSLPSEDDRKKYLYMLSQNGFETKGVTASQKAYEFRPKADEMKKNLTEGNLKDFYDKLDNLSLEEQEIFGESKLTYPEFKGLSPYKKYPTVEDPTGTKQKSENTRTFKERLMSDHPEEGIRFFNEKLDAAERKRILDNMDNKGNEEFLKAYQEATSKKTSMVNKVLGIPTAEAMMIKNPKKVEPNIVTERGVYNQKGFVTAFNTPPETGVKIAKLSPDDFDLTKYATSPEHIENVKRIYNSLGKLDTPDEINNEIDRVAKIQGKQSPLEGMGKVIIDVANKYQVPVKMMMAAMRQDTTYGINSLTKNNPGNIGNNDQGQKISYDTIEEGIDVVGKFLNKIKKSNTATTNIAMNMKGNYVAGKTITPEEEKLYKSKELSDAFKPYWMGKYADSVNQRIYEGEIDKKTREKLYKDVPLTDKAKKLLDEKMALHTLRDINQKMAGGEYFESEKSVPGANFTPAKNIGVSNIYANSGEDVVLHESLHALLMETGKDKNESWVKSFNTEWENLKKKPNGPDLQVFDDILISDPLYKGISESQRANERFAFLGGMLGKDGLTGFPKELRKYYQDIFATKVTMLNK